MGDKMFKKNEKTKTTKPLEKHKNNNASFSVFQIVIFAFLFVLMIWIIGFLSLEIDSQKQEIQKLHTEFDNIQKDGDEIFKYYVDKIRDFQKIDIKDQVETFGRDIKDELQDVKDSMFNKEDLSNVNGRIDALEEYNNTYRGTNLVLLTSVGLLRDVINRGQNFEIELETLEVVGGRQPIVIESIEILKPFANSGVKTFTQLKREFDEKAHEIVFISNNPLSQNPTYKEKFLHKLKSLLKIRKIDLEDKRDTPSTIVARVEYYLNDNKLDEAVHEIEKLKDIAPSGFDFIKSWYDEAKARVNVDNKMTSISSFALERALNDIYKGNPKLKKDSKFIIKTNEVKTESKNIKE